MTALLLALAQLGVPVTPEAARHGFDPDRIAAAHRLLEANGSAANRPARLAAAMRAAVLAPLTDCLERAGAKSKRTDDCAAVATAGHEQIERLPALIPSLLDQIGTIEERVYAERFTAAEIDDIARFAASDAGRKLAREGDGLALEARLGVRDLIAYALRHAPAGAQAIPAPAPSPAPAPRP